MKVISIANQKGGCGKTTTAVNLATYLALKGKRVLLLDLDPQGAATEGVGVDKWKLEKSIYDVMVDETPIQEVVKPTAIPGLDIVPSNLDLSGAEMELASTMAREFILKEKLEPLDYDYVLIDSPPSLGLLTINSLTACDTLIIPLQCEYYALAGMSMLLKVVERVAVKLGNKPQRWVLLTMYDARTSLSKQIADQVKDYFKGEVFRTVVPRNVKLAEAPSFGKPIQLYDPSSSGAIAYEQLAEEVLHG
jgi:chromosome partitioning protein